MTTDPAVEIAGEATAQIPSTAGMTTKVVKGSLWTLAGSILPIAVAFVAMPITVRLLGPEGYGVLLLVGLIPTYFSFADLGMSVAAIRFGSEAYGRGDRQREAEVVRTAASIALVSSSAVALPIFLFSYPIVQAFNVPEVVRTEASVALKMSSIAFVVAILMTVVNAPMYARLRMDLNALTNSGSKVLLSAFTPVVLYLGGGISGAVTWALFVTIAGFWTVVLMSRRLLPELLSGGINRELFRPLLTLGGGWFIAMLAAVLLVNLEKLILTKLVSVEALAYYSVAFTLANMATMFSQAMIQSLLPAFSQLLSPEKRDEFDVLLGRGIRLLLIWAVPALVMMVILARPFFTIWLGEQFGRESTLPFYVLVGGLFFNILGFIPHAAITAVGRTDVLAKLYWFELAIYAVAAFVLISYFGILGAAIAWSFRVILDAFLVIFIAKKIAGMKFKFLNHVTMVVLAAMFLVPSLVLSLIYGGLSIPVIVSAPIGVLIYAWLVWTRFVEKDERTWIENRLRTLLRFQ